MRGGEVVDAAISGIWSMENSGNCIVLYLTAKIGMSKQNDVCRMSRVRHITNFGNRRV